MDFKDCHLTYTKINTLYKRDEKGKIMFGEYSRPEFEYLINNKWMAFEKVDGTNVSFYWDGKELQIHGKNDSTNIPKHLMEEMESILPIDKLRETFHVKFDENGNEIPIIVRIYGEGYGNKIQKYGNFYNSKKCEFRVFDIKINNFWLEWNDVCDICKKLGLKTVVRYSDMTLKEAEEMVIKGFKSTISEDKELIAEGLVLRPTVQLFNKMNERIMVKIKHCDYNK